MRELQECQAEVFRRSEIRIQARRKRRKHILLACVPLALAVFAVMLFPAIPRESQKNSASPEPAYGSPESYAESFTCSVAKITVSGNGFSQTHTDSDRILQISAQLNSYAARGSKYTGTTADGNGEKSESSPIAPETSLGGLTDSNDTYGDTPEYAITLVMHQGAPTLYLLQGNTLRNQTTNKTYTLSQEEAEALKGLLGICHP